MPMDGFDVPNENDAEYPQQAEPDSLDWQTIAAGHRGHGVLDGCLVEAQGSPNMTVNVTSGSIRHEGSASVAIASDDLVIDTADSLVRFDLIVAEADGDLRVVQGTPSAAPEFPDAGGDVLLAAIIVPVGATSILAEYIIDKRVLIEGAPTGAVDVQVFTADGTWTKPAGATLLEVILIGQGGGGGAGRRGTSGSSGGGGGGGGGAFVRAHMPAAAVSATEAVNLNGAGAGGPAQTSNDTNGANGTAGEDTTFGSHLRAKGGNFGGGGQSPSGGTQGAETPIAGNSFGEFHRGQIGGNGSSSTGSDGADSPNATGTGTLDYTETGPGGGGGGGGANTGTGSIGGAGGDCWDETGGTAGNQAVGGVGGSANTNEPSCGAGGGGGGCVITSGAGRAGGNGGNYGGGGGGGSGSVNGQASGAGGNGGNGICVVVTYSA